MAQSDLSETSNHVNMVYIIIIMENTVHTLTIQLCNRTINMCSKDHYKNATFDLWTSLNQTFRSIFHLSKISDFGISPCKG